MEYFFVFYLLCIIFLFLADYVHFLLTQKSIKHDLLLKELKNGMELLSYVQNPSLFQV
jgi:hypothetical protein